jgi:hypothetical protein
MVAYQDEAPAFILPTELAHLTYALHPVFSTAANVPHACFFMQTPPLSFAKRGSCIQASHLHPEPYLLPLYPKATHELLASHMARQALKVHQLVELPWGGLSDIDVPRQPPVPSVT